MALTDFHFWLNFIYFAGAAFVAFFIPGNVVVERFSLTKFQHLVLSLGVGMVFWAWQGFLFGVLNARILTYLYLVTFLVIWLRPLKFGKFTRPKIDWLILGLVGLGTGVQLISTFMVGVKVGGSLYFCCSLPDSLYHISLTNQLIKNIPPIEPGASGVIVSSYHYWANLVAADLIRIFKLPLIATQYQYLVVLLSLMIGLLAIVFGQLLKLGRGFISWLLFFLYFSGDMTYLLLFFLGKGLNFNLPYLENASWLWISPPRVFGLVVFLTGLSLLVVWLKRSSPLLIFTLALIFSSLVGFKIYFGIFAFVGLAALVPYFVLKKGFARVLLPLTTVLLGGVIYMLTDRGSGGLIFTGIWRFEDFIVSPILGLSYLELARQIYFAHHNLPRLVEYFLIYASIYIVFVFGTLNIGFFQTKKTLLSLGAEINIFLLSGILVSFIIGAFFIQQTGGANSSQFLITAELIASIYAALAAFYWTKRVGMFYLGLVALIVLLTIPRVTFATVNSLKAQLSHQGFSVDSAEITALDYLKNNTEPNSLILVDNVNKNHWRNAYSYYISFLSDRQIFLDGEGIAQDHGVGVEDKLKDMEIIFKGTDTAQVKETLHKNKIDYIYLAATDNLAATSAAQFIKTVFKNNEIKILKVR